MQLKRSTPAAGSIPQAMGWRLAWKDPEGPAWVVSHSLEKLLPKKRNFPSLSIRQFRQSSIQAHRKMSFSTYRSGLYTLPSCLFSAIKFIFWSSIFPKKCSPSWEQTFFQRTTREKAIPKYYGYYLNVVREHFLKKFWIQKSFGMGSSCSSCGLRDPDSLNTRSDGRHARL